jgi:hypothetical protein
MQLRSLSNLSAKGCLLFFTLAMNDAYAEVVALAPAHDTTLIEVQPDRNNGGEGWVNAGTTQNGQRNRGLFQWDFTGVIPPDANILSVSLALQVTRVPGCGRVDSSFSMYPMLRAWGEGDKIALDNRGGQGAPATPGEATWNERFFATASWGAPGGAPGVDFAASASASQFIYDIGRSPYTFASDSGLLTDVQNWVKNPQTNFGWILISDDEATPFTARRFGSREDPLGNGPILTVDFQIVPEPGTFALTAAGLISLICVPRLRNLMSSRPANSAR